MTWDTIWLDARVATVVPGRLGLGVIERGVVAARDGRIAFVGTQDELPTGWDAAERISLDGRLVTPGLIDCHTQDAYIDAVCAAIPALARDGLADAVDAFCEGIAFGLRLPSL